MREREPERKERDRVSERERVRERAREHVHMWLVGDGEEQTGRGGGVVVGGFCMRLKLSRCSGTAPVPATAVVF